MIDLSKQYGFGNYFSIGTALSKLVLVGFAIAGIAVVMYFLIGAFLIITSAGDKNAVAKARGMITHSIIGFVLLILMFLVLLFIPAWLGFQNYSIINGDLKP